MAVRAFVAIDHKMKVPVSPPTHFCLYPLSAGSWNGQEARRWQVFGVSWTMGCESITESFTDIGSFSGRARKLFDAEATQLEGGLPSVRVQVIPLPGLTAYRFSTSVRLMLRGRLGEGHVLVVPIFGDSQGSRFHGELLAPGDLVWATGEAETQLIIGPGVDHVGMVIKKAMVRSAIERFCSGKSKFDPDRNQVVEVPLDCGQRFAAGIKMLLDKGSDELARGSDLDAELIEQGLGGALPLMRGVRVGERARKRQEVVERALWLMRNELSGKLSVQDICETLNVRRRTLFYAFESRFGLSPQETYRVLRMAKAQELFRTTEKSVREVAQEVGFLHQGRFAREYSNRFHRQPRHECNAKRARSPLRAPRHEGATVDERPARLPGTIASIRS
jgi:AraC-like DNA-binding protein